MIEQEIDENIDSLPIVNGKTDINFMTTADEFLKKIPGFSQKLLVLSQQLNIFRTQANSLADDVNEKMQTATNKANEASQSANSAGTAAQEATNKADEASQSANGVGAAAQEATDKANEASQSATAAAQSAQQAAQILGQKQDTLQSGVNIKTINNVDLLGEGNITIGIPSGVITMWSGSIASIPAGWTLCDGANGTPDLRNRFIIGASVDNVGVSNTTITGSNTKTGGSKDAIVVAHTHTGSTSTTGSHNHLGGSRMYNNISSTYGQVAQAVLNTIAGWVGSNQANHLAYTSSDGSHSHTITVDSSGSSGTNANLPPYLALAYIMKL